MCLVRRGGGGGGDAAGICTIVSLYMIAIYLPLNHSIINLNMNS